METQTARMPGITAGPVSLMAQPRILIVEDERALTEVLSYNLLREGYEVLVAHDGRVADTENYQKLAEGYSSEGSSCVASTEIREKFTEASASEPLCRSTDTRTACVTSAN